MDDDLMLMSVCNQRLFVVGEFCRTQVTTLVRRRQPSLNTLNVLLEVEPFPGPDPESEFFSFLF